MKRIPFRWMVAVGCGLLLTISMSSFSQKYGYRENAVPKPVNMSERLQRLFAKTKLVCFGRYALELPIEGKLDWGSESTLEAYEGGMKDARQHASGLIAKLKQVPNTSTVEVIYEGEGPVADTWQMRYFERETDKEMGMLLFRTYIVKGENVFITVDITHNGENEAKVAARQADLVKRIRLRADDEVPTEPGLCTEFSFVAEATYSEQEMVNVGIHLPGFPDVSFSVSSNKDAYADYSKADMDSIRDTELSLLGRIAGAKKDQPFTYPYRDVFREGKRDLHHWHGEESLYKRKNGMHDFEWALVGTPRDVANPSEFNARMYTKVAHNTAGAAEEASLTDDEAVALFDRLLSGLKFRVKVPGAPPGSYYFPEDKPTK